MRMLILLQTIFGEWAAVLVLILRLLGIEL